MRATRGATATKYRTRLVNPATLQSSVQFWISAKDTSSITLNGSTVSQINDKSSFQRHLTQSTASAQPTYNATGLNGLPTLVFTGSQILNNTSPGALLRNAPNAALYAVCEYANNAATRTALFAAIAVSTATRVVISVDPAISATGHVAAGRRLDADSFQSVSSTGTFAANTALVQSAIFDWTNSDLFLYINNFIQGSNLSFQSSGLSSDTNSSALSIGGAATAANFQGKISEALIISGDISLRTHLGIIQYLKNEWKV